MMSRISVFASLVAASASSAALGQRAQLSTGWWIEPIEPPAGIRQLGSKEFVLKQRLLPNGLTKLSRAVDKPEVRFGVPAGTELIEISGAPFPTYCEGQFHQGVGNQMCFVDQNSDTRFDASFDRKSQTPALVTITGSFPKKLAPLAAPIPYQSLDPANSTISAFVAIERRNFFNIYGRESFTILFGSGDKQERITDAIQFKSVELPKQLHILGSDFTALAEKDGLMAIRVDSAMPRQEIGVTQTVRFR